MVALANDETKVWERNRFMILIFTLAFLFLTVPALAQPRVVAYYPGWMRSRLPANKVLFQHLTHINHAFAWPLANGSITGYSEINHPELIAEAHKAGRKILIALGGWGQSAGFAPMAADSTVRQKFVKNLVDYCASRGYDGADFDWEFPQNAVERTNLTILIKEVRQAFGQVNPNWLLTMVAVASNYSGQWHDYAALAPYVDWFNLMAYDFHGSWTNHAGHNSPLYAPATDFDGSAHQGVQYLRGQRGLPKEKIHLGMPFYGKECSASRLYGPSPSTSWTDLEYSLVAPRLNSGWDYFWDEVSKVPYLLNTARTKFVTFDDSLSISFKCEYAKTNGLAGVMIWALGQDVLGNAQPLLEAVGRAMLAPTGVASEKPAVAKNFVLFDNYPNPLRASAFNAATAISFQLERDTPVDLSVYDLTGNLVAVLKHAVLSAGRHTVVWEASGFASGVYFYKLEVAGFSEVKKMILTK
jgi:chitinase